MNQSCLKHGVLLVMFILLTSCKTAYKPLATVESVELDRYLGKWYEIASYPQYFQKGCKCTTADYAKDAEFISVTNRCFRNDKWDQALGRATLVPESGNAKLKVWFFWPFKGDYWILKLGEDEEQVSQYYQYAVVGHPSREYLWILARTPQMEPKLYQSVLDFVDSLDFDHNRLVKTQQDCQDGL